MTRAVKLRDDYSASDLRRLAARSRQANAARRLLALAAIRDGASRTDAARVGGMDRQTLRDWVHRFNAEGPDGLRDYQHPGPACRLNGAQQAELKALVEAGPDRQRDGVVRWRRIDLQRVIRERFGVIYHERHVSTLLKRLGFSHVSARPRHPGQDPAVMEAFKKNFPRILSAHIGHLPKGKPIEIWFQDEARIGQKNGIVRQWARRGTRPRQPADQRYENAWLFGAICPARGKAAGLVLPFVGTASMQLHIEEISRYVARGAHAVVLLDRAGWHTTSKLKLPRNVSLIFLPSRAPELNPVENIWQFLRANWLANTVFDGIEHIIDAACSAWNNLAALPDTIRSIGLRKWAHTGQCP
ncbi:MULTISPECIES: IS630 family transposase [Acetobacteraceae]|uniref:IS630 family transposase n=1 Tax=Acetobacteraceae TaxID=433 RepID=UPI000A2F1033|nr:MULTISPECIES: IS630 family transposase [Acetobacteraceae]